MTKFLIDFDNAIGLARHMYHTLTSSYSYLFRNRHPLDIDWQKEENFARLGRGVDRQRMWIQLDRVKERTRCFCKLIRPFKIISLLNSSSKFQLSHISTTKTTLL